MGRFGEMTGSFGGAEASGAAQSQAHNPIGGLRLRASERVEMRLR